MLSRSIGWDLVRIALQSRTLLTASGPANGVRALCGSDLRLKLDRIPYRNQNTDPFTGTGASVFWMAAD